MMTCKNCGRELQGHEKFCGFCGAAVPAEKPEYSDVPELTLTPPETLLYDSEPTREEPVTSTAEHIMGQEPPEAPGSKGMPEPETRVNTCTAERPRGEYNYSYSYTYKTPPENGNRAPQNAYAYRPAAPAPAEDRVLGMWSYVLSLFLMSLPVAGLVLQIVWACGATDSLNRRNLARGALFLWVVRLAFSAMLLLCFMALFSRLFYSLPDLIDYYLY